MKNCGIALETLADYRDGRADADTAARIQAHLERDCIHCRQELDWLQRTAATLRASQEVKVPERSLARAHSLFRERFRAEVKQSPLASWLAQLQFDSRRSSLSMSGARSGAREGIQLVYSTVLYDIDLFQEPAGQGKWHLTGNVLPRAGEEIIVPDEIVLLSRDGSRRSFSPENEEFHLPSIPEGEYDVLFRLAPGEITIRSIGIGM